VIAGHLCVPGGGPVTEQSSRGLLCAEVLLQHSMAHRLQQWQFLCSVGLQEKKKSKRSTCPEIAAGPVQPCQASGSDPDGATLMVCNLSNNVRPGHARHVRLRACS
jgi:hypothetical protein